MKWFNQKRFRDHPDAVLARRLSELIHDMHLADPSKSEWEHLKDLRDQLIGEKEPIRFYGPKPFSD